MTSPRARRGVRRVTHANRSVARNQTNESNNVDGGGMIELIEV